MTASPRAHESTLDQYFHLSSRQTTLSREIRGGVATFLTMAYILFANSDILSAAGVPKDSAVACTALAAGICCILMGLVANFPLALASGMGLNAVVAFTIAKQTGSWQTAMGLIVLDGLLVLILVLLGLREAVMHAIPRDLRLAIGAGIGLFIALIGMVNSGIIRRGQPFEPVLMPGHLAAPSTLVAIAGLILTMILLARRVTGALLIGIAAGALLALALKLTKLPESLSLPNFSAAFQADVSGALHWRYIPLLLSVVMVDFFDTLGTVTAIAEQAQLTDAKGRIPNLRRILLVDSLSASIGGLLGASSVTSYIESSTGIAEGARTGLHSITVGLLFLLAIFLAPLASIVPAQATAPALILVGFYMISQFATVDFTKLDTAIPAFLILITIPLTYSIAHGIGYGFISYTLINLATLRIRSVHPLMYLTSIAFAAYFWSQH